MKKVAHLTSVHPRYDARIFHKMCKSLSSYYETFLIVSDGKGNEKKEGVAVFDVGLASSRVERIVKITNKIFHKALHLNADIYHLHDPELIPIGLRLKQAGKRVIFDVHEDVPKQILSKHYISPILRKLLSFTYKVFEIYTLWKLHYVVAATPVIRKKYEKLGIRAIDINNFPIKDEFIDIVPDYKSNKICYIGSLYRTRGIKEIVQAIEGLDIELIIAGIFHDKDYEKEVRGLKGWQQVDFRGFVGREDIREILRSCFAGVVTLYPTPAYKEAYPVKLFEYMLAGLPVIASDFYNHLYGKFGIGVNPYNIKEIRNAILFLSQKAKGLGEGAKEFAQKHYSWDTEMPKLLNVYKDIVG